MSFRGRNKFLEFRYKLQEYESLSDIEKKEYIFNSFVNLVLYAQKNVSIYRNYWSNTYTSLSFSDLEDFTKIPLIDKNFIQQNISSFRPLKNNYITVTTGGSTGIQLVMFHELDYWIKDWAYICHFWSKCTDYENLSKKITLRGNYQKKPIEYDPIHGYTVSSSMLTINNIELIHNELNSCDIPIVHAYPSAIVNYIKMLNSLGISYCEKEYDCIFLGSENVYSWQLKLIKDFFNCHIFYWYGHSELCVFAPYCRLSKDYSTFGHYGFSFPNNDYVVGTSFNKYSSPLINYITDDQLIKPSFLESGELRFKCISGRKSEMLIGIDGIRIPMTSINMHGDEFKNIKQFKFIQFNINEVIFTYVNMNNLKVNEDNVKISLEKKLHNFNIKIKKVESIKISKNGKHCFLEQNINENF